MELTPKEHELISNNTAIQEIINRLDCALIPSEDAIAQSTIRNGVDKIFQQLPNPEHHEK